MYRMYDGGGGGGEGGEGCSCQYYEWVLKIGTNYKNYTKKYILV